MILTEDMVEQLSEIKIICYNKYSESLNKCDSGKSVVDVIDECVNKAVKKVEKFDWYDFESNVRNDKERAIADVLMITKKHIEYIINSI